MSSEPENLENFVAEVNRLLDEDDIGELIEVVFDDDRSRTVRLCCMEIFQAICARLIDNHIHDSDFEKFSCLESVLDHLCRTCNPKEMLLAAMEQLESVGNDSLFGLLCRLLKTVLVRLPAKRPPEYAFMTCLELMIKYTNKIPVLPEYGLAENETALAENCPVAARMINVCNSCLLFVQPFISEVLHHSNRKDERNVSDRATQSRLLTNFLLRLFEYPIGQLHWSFERPHLNTAALQVTRDIFELIGVLCPDYIWKLPLRCTTGQSSNNESAKLQNIEEPSTIGIGMVVYCYFTGVLQVVLDDSLLDIATNTCLQCTHVYSSSYQFETYLQLLTWMCHYSTSPSSKTLVSNRCLSVLHVFVSQLQLHSFTLNWLSSQNAQDFILTLIGLLFAQSSAESTTKVVQLIQHLVHALNTEAQLAFVRFCFSSKVELEKITKDENQTVIFLAWIVDWLRKQITSSVEYKANDLRSVLNLVFELESAETSDILARHALHSAACILYTRLAIMDEKQRPVSSQTMKSLNCTYLSPLRRGIELTRAHYKLEISNMEKNAELVTKSSEIVVDNTKKEFLKMSITKLDLISSQLSRALQLAENFP